MARRGDWSRLRADTPAAIRRLLRRCLEKDRIRRLADAADARLDIDEATANKIEVRIYEPLGFLATMSLLLFSLVFIVERKPILPAAAFSVGVTVFAYVLFGTLLRSPLPRGLLGF